MCERRISTIALVHKNLQFLPSFKCQDVDYIVGSHNKNKNWSASCPGRNTHGDEHTHTPYHMLLCPRPSAVLDKQGELQALIGPISSTLGSLFPLCP